MRLQLILFVCSILSATLSGAEHGDSVTKKRNKKGLDKFTEKHEMKRRSAEDDEYEHKRFNKYKDLSEEEHDESDEYDEKKKKFRWNKNFKNHKYNSYDKYDDVKHESSKLSKKRVDGEAFRKYSKSKNEQHHKKKSNEDSSSNEDVADLKMEKNIRKMEVKSRGVKPKFEVKEGRRRSLKDEEDTSEDVDDVLEGSSENVDESHEFDSDLLCDSSEDSCDV